MDVTRKAEVLCEELACGLLEGLADAEAGSSHSLMGAFRPVTEKLPLQCQLSGHQRSKAQQIRRPAVIRRILVTGVKTGALFRRLPAIMVQGSF